MELRVLAILVAMTGWGCVSQAGDFVRPEVAELDAPGTWIEAEDGSFRIVAGDDVRTPFWAYDCPARPVTTNFALGERLGGYRVRVKHPDVAEPLYGILSFCHVHESARGPILRSYNIRVPADRVAQTTAGRVSVVYEPYGYVRPYADGTADVPAWILWLSRSPFPR